MSSSAPKVSPLKKKKKKKRGRISRIKGKRKRAANEHRWLLTSLILGADRPLVACKSSIERNLLLVLLIVQLLVHPNVKLEQAKLKKLFLRSLIGTKDCTQSCKGPCKIQCEASKCESNCIGGSCNLECMNSDSESCQQTCAQGACDIKCTAKECKSECLGGNCADFQCTTDQGDCSQICEKNCTNMRCKAKECRQTCTKGHCNMRCEKDSDMCVMSCPGGNCLLECNGIKCKRDCNGGNCQNTGTGKEEEAPTAVKPSVQPGKPGDAKGLVVTYLSFLLPVMSAYVLSGH